MNDTILKKLAKPLIVLATLIWGSTFFILKDTLVDISVFFMLAFRFTLAAVILALVFYRSWKELDKSYLLGGGAMGVMLFCAYTVQNYGLMGTTPGKNAFFTAVYCVIVPFLYWGIDKTRPDRYNVAAAVLCVAGIGLVSWDGGFSLGRGDVLTLIGGVCYAVHIIIVAHFSKGRDIFLLTVLQFAVVAVLSWGAALATGGLPKAGQLSGQAVVVLLYLAVAATAMALLFQNIGQKYTNPSAAAVLLALEAPFGVLFSMLFYRERPTGLMLLGFGLIFGAVVCSETKLSFLQKKRVDNSGADAYNGT